MANVHDVAAYILGRLGSMTTMKLQKLVYYSQGWSLAWDGEPLFPEKIQAWANGPVVYDLFRQHRGQFRVADWPKGDPESLSVAQQETIDAVLGAYGHLSGQALSDKTHEERPWLNARAGLAPGAASGVELSLDEMQDFFGGLASAL